MKNKPASIQDRSLISRIVVYFILWLTAMVMLAPLFWAILTSLKPNSEIFQAPYRINPRYTEYSGVLRRIPPSAVPHLSLEYP
jgi:ABC-type glycerol-3-phosphate transport system permease component